MPSNLNKREAAIRAAMKNASLPEQRRLAGELDRIASVRQDQQQRNNEVDLAARQVRSTLSPVLVHGMHTAATDWIGESTTGYSKSEMTKIKRNAQVEASAWFRSTSAVVRSYQDEFAEQARGFARRTASQYGEAAPVIERGILSHIASLYRTAEGTDAAGIESAAEGDGPGSHPEATDWADEIAIDGGEAGETEVPEDSGIEVSPYDHEYEDAAPESFIEGGDEFSSIEEPPSVTASIWSRAANQYLAAEEGTTPAQSPAEVDEEQSGEAGSQLPREVSVTERGQSFPNFIEPKPAENTSSERAKNISANARRRRVAALRKWAADADDADDMQDEQEQNTQDAKDSAGQAASAVGDLADLALAARRRTAGAMADPNCNHDWVIDDNTSRATYWGCRKCDGLFVARNGENPNNLYTGSRPQNRRTAGEWSEVSCPGCVANGSPAGEIMVRENGEWVSRDCPDCVGAGSPAGVIYKNSNRKTAERGDFSGVVDQAWLDQRWIDSDNDTLQYGFDHDWNLCGFCDQELKIGDDYANDEEVGYAHEKCYHDSNYEMYNQKWLAPPVYAIRRKRAFDMYDLEEPLSLVDNPYYDFCPMCYEESLDKETLSCVECGYTEYNTLEAKRRRATRKVSVAQRRARVARLRKWAAEGSEETNPAETDEGEPQAEDDWTPEDNMTSEARRRRNARRGTKRKTASTMCAQCDSAPATHKNVRGYLELCDDCFDSGAGDMGAGEREGRRRRATRKTANDEGICYYVIDAPGEGYVHFRCANTFFNSVGTIDHTATESDLVADYENLGMLPGDPIFNCLLCGRPVAEVWRGGYNNDVQVSPRYATKKTAINFPDMGTVMADILDNVPNYGWFHAIDWDYSALSKFTVTAEDPDDENRTFTESFSAGDMEQAINQLIQKGYTHCGGTSISDLDSWDACVSDDVLQQVVYGDIIFG